MKTFTQLTGTTDLTSNVKYPGSFTALSLNNTAANVALGASLMNDQHRYLIQKYFDNERQVSFATIGGQTNLLLTAGLSAAAVSGTMTATWANITCNQLVNFSDGEQRYCLFTNGSAAISWSVPLNSSVTTSIKTVGVQSYNIPANVSKIDNNTINVGQLKYQPRPVMSRAEWDQINFLPYTSDIPNYFYIYNGQLNIFPIPSTTGNIITFNYKTKVPDLSFTDYTTGTLAAAGMVAGSTTITGLLTSWGTTGKYPIGVDVSSYNLMFRADPPYGDGIWYPISMFNSDTSLTLSLPAVNAPNITALTTYTIGQVPLLDEDFHDMLVYGALKTYYSTIVSDPNKFKEYDSMYSERLELLKSYAGTKTTNVDLEAEPANINPNLFMYAN